MTNLIKARLPPISSAGFLEEERELNFTLALPDGIQAYFNFGVNMLTSVTPEQKAERTDSVANEAQLFAL